MKLLEAMLRERGMTSEVAIADLIASFGQERIISHCQQHDLVKARGGQHGGGLLAHHIRTDELWEVPDVQGKPQEPSRTPRGPEKMYRWRCQKCEAEFDFGFNETAQTPKCDQAGVGARNCGGELKLVEEGKA